VSKASPKPRSKPKQKASNGQSGIRKFFSFISSPWVRRPILLIIVIGLLYWFMPRLIALGAKAWQGSLALFGAGLAILAVALGVMIWVVWQGYFSASGRFSSLRPGMGGLT